MIRPIASVKCGCCHERRGVRRFEVGDILPGRPGAHIPTDSMHVDTVVQDAAAETTGDTTDAGRPRVVDPITDDPLPPPGWQDRVKLLPCNTLIHIPITCRLRLATATTELWHGMANRKKFGLF